MWKGKPRLLLTGICIETFPLPVLLHQRGIRGNRGMGRMEIRMMLWAGLHWSYHLLQCPLHSHFGIRTYIILAGHGIACIVQN